MFSSLTEKFDGIFAGLRSRGKLTERDIKDTTREVRRALLEADVNFRVARDFVGRIEERVVGSDIVKHFTPAQQIVKIVHEELTELLGGKARLYQPTHADERVMVVGLQGSGKTTFCAKLASVLRRSGRKPLLVALDVYRPAAADQLEVLARSIDVPIARGAPEDRDVNDLYRRAVGVARGLFCDALILDTAGRLHIDDEMMAELEGLGAEAQPHETFLVLDSMTGQEAVHVASAFRDRLGVTGAVLTKLDGDARGGAALSVRAVTGVPIRFASAGERIDTLEPFYPDRMAGRILGMGDMMSLIEKTQSAVDSDKAAQLEQKIREDAFDLTDFLEQLQQIRKMGPLEDVMKMIPGASKAMAKGMNVEQGQLDRVQAIIQSMTPGERSRPSLIDGSRRRRIARGSGTTVQAVNSLLKQFAQMKKMMKNLSKFQKMQKRMRLPFSFH